MAKVLLIPFVSALLFISCAPVPSSTSSSGTSTARGSGVKTASAIPKDLQATGAFDYYLLTLSWAPEFCHSKPNSPECSGHFGFIVHGLWPQNNAGGYPENCGYASGPTNPQALLDLMPDLHLIQHEWTTHGTCTGLSADNYLALIRRIRTSLQIPQNLVAPDHQITLSSADLKQDFEHVNPELNDSEIALTCGGGSYLVGVEFCFSKDGKPQPCGSDIRDCNRPSIRIPRVQ
jgi:ribonuclease T2